VPAETTITGRPKPPQSHHLDRRAHELAERLAATDEELLYSTAELAEILHVSSQFLEIGRHRGFGPPFIRLSPRRIRYRSSDLIRWLEERKHASTAEYAGGRPSRPMSSEPPR
jgi:hypothetical protein